MSNDVVLKVEHLSTHFKLGDKTLKAVDNVSFEVKRGEVLGIVGESGCGKTTLGRTIIGLYKPQSGRVILNNEAISGGESYPRTLQEEFADYNTLGKEEQGKLEREYANLKSSYRKEAKKINSREKRTRNSLKIQMIFQDPIASLDPRMTVRDIIAEGLIIQGERDKKVIMQNVGDVLESVGLVSDHANRYPHEFSGGQRQRIGVARAAVMQPTVIIADEPVSALDVSIQAQVIMLLDKLRQKLGLTIIFIAHDISVVKYFSNRIAVMYFGKIVELADSDELFAHPLHPYTRSLLSAIPYPDPNYEKTRVRFVYEPEKEHDYSTDLPKMQEVRPGHFVYANGADLEKVNC